MAKLVWDSVGDRLFETGVSNGVLFVYDSANHTYEDGVAWNGLVSVSENPTGAEANAFWADNIKYLNLVSAEEFAATIEAYTYPDEFAPCNGEELLTTGIRLGQQKRKSFAFSYQTRIGNDTDGSDYGYQIHLVYGAIAAPTQKQYSSINESVEPITFSWDITTTPVEIPETNYKPVAHLVINSTAVDAAKLTAFKNKLYGDTNTSSTLPLPAEVIADFA